MNRSNRHNHWKSEPKLVDLRCCGDRSYTSTYWNLSDVATCQPVQPLTISTLINHIDTVESRRPYNGSDK